MAEYIQDVMSKTSKLDWAFPFQRTGAFPLDRSAVFSSLSDAQAYALGDGSDERALGGTSYVGQIISVYEVVENEEPSVNAYIITPARGLMKLASATVSGDIAADVSNLQQEVNSIVSNIETLELLIADKADAEEVAANLDTKANAKDVYTKEEVYTKTEVETYVNGQVASAGHLKREIVETLPLTSSADVDTIYMVKKIGGLIAQDHYEEYMVINGTWELIGDTYVDLTNYATTEYVDGKVQLLEGIIGNKADSESVNAALELKANQSDLDSLVKIVTDNKTEVDTALLLKADKTYVDEELAKKANSADVYTKGETYTRSEISDLIADITGGESAADVLAALNAYKGTNDERVANVESRIQALEDVEADDNVIEAIKLAGASEALPIVDKIVTIPAATVETYGLVKLSNEVGVDAAGAMEVKNLNVNKLSQTEGDWLILNGGTASI